jgi:hypothetical protein
MNDKEYKDYELKLFLNQKHPYFDKIKDFDTDLQNMDILEQIEWIENGSYGAGACIALKNTLESLTNRMNKNARIGNVILHVFYGAPFRYWNKLSSATQAQINDAISTWLKQEHNFAI